MSVRARLGGHVGGTVMATDVCWEIWGFNWELGRSELLGIPGLVPFREIISDSVLIRAEFAVN